MKWPAVKRERHGEPTTAAKWPLGYQAASSASDVEVGIARPGCPDCGETLLRIPRRLVDRLSSVLSPVKRYQCPSARCQWRGNMPAQAYVAGRPGQEPRS